MITGIWISPDRRKLAVQFDESAVTVLDAKFEQLLDLDEAQIGGAVPHDWEVVFEPEVQGDYEGLDLDETAPVLADDPGYGA